MNAKKNQKPRKNGNRVSSIRTIALIAHDGKKVDIVSWATANVERLKKFRLIATATTGKLLKEKVGLRVKTLLSGPEGGDVQIASLAAEGKVNAVFFFMDPLDAHPHDPDIRAVMRVCNVHNIPFASNLATASLFIGIKDFLLSSKQPARGYPLQS